LDVPQTRTHGWKTSKVHFILQILIKVVSAFHSGVFSCLLAEVITIIRGGLADTSGCKTRANAWRMAKSSEVMEEENLFIAIEYFRVLPAM